MKGSKARVKFLDNGDAAEVDISMVDVKKDSYVEVFADQAIGKITKKQAEFKRDLRLEMNRLRGASS